MYCKSMYRSTNSVFCSGEKRAKIVPRTKILEINSGKNSTSEEKDRPVRAKWKRGRLISIKNSFAEAAYRQKLFTYPNVGPFRKEKLTREGAPSERLFSARLSPARLSWEVDREEFEARQRICAAECMRSSGDMTSTITMFSSFLTIPQSRPTLMAVKRLSPENRIITGVSIKVRLKMRCGKRLQHDHFPTMQYQLGPNRKAIFA
ncbi:hypothetical protein RvY_08951 [Ramazzottius varieornatus]|uniref:Uncharacterized protein n=1 Tax=Ramazzottius varieornatus TaxID=947166 RepID=A0A1D1V7M8_RAMVA|nr:hypothetical protein RvY_08951 [Ramazzottius varieornatus]